MLLSRIMQKLVLVAMLALPATGCDSQACTLIGCGAGFLVDFQRAAWTPGSYKVAVVADGDAIECTAELPLNCDASLACPGASNVLLILDGCAVDPSKHRIVGIEFEEGFAPKAVEVRVFQDDMLLGEGTYMPEYSESFPNGPDCGSACVSAESVVLALSE